jgi:ATP-dependent RNA helicase RhlE
MSSFETLGLSAALLRGVTEAGYTVPTPIQAKVIPVVLQGGDVLGGAQTGTGKTAGFTLPMLQRLSSTPPPQGSRRGVRALILTPTRELAAQVEDSVRRYGKYVPMRSAAIFGGVSINPQTSLLRRGVDILVATPGRLLDHAAQNNVDLRTVEIFVLDEADRMLDMGFLPDIKRVLALLPQKRQNLLFSATFPEDIRNLANRLLDKPALIEVAPPNATADRIKQLVHYADKGDKRALLSWLIAKGDWRQVLVFTRTKHGANRLADQLDQDGHTAAAIHGNKSQGARTRALADFKANKVRVLVATDIAARGIDIDQLPHVVNYELPEVPEHYVHRIGRTGRAGRDGLAVSLVSNDERSLLRDIERLLGQRLPVGGTEGFDRNAIPRPAPREREPQGGAPPNAGRADFSENRGGDARRGAGPGRHRGGHGRGQGHGQGQARSHGGRGPAPRGPGSDQGARGADSQARQGQPGVANDGRPPQRADQRSQAQPGRGNSGQPQPNGRPRGKSRAGRRRDARVTSGRLY